MFSSKKANQSLTHHKVASPANETLTHLFSKNKVENYKLKTTDSAQSMHCFVLHYFKTTSPCGTVKPHLHTHSILQYPTGNGV